MFVFFPILLILQLDDETINEVYESTHKYMFAIAFKILRDTYDAEDILHDVFIALQVTSTEFNDKEHLKKWMARVCAYKSITKSKKNQRSIPIENMEWYCESDVTSIENDVLDKIILDSILSTIPPEMRDPLRDYILDSQRLSVISDKYGISRAKIKYWRKIFINRVEQFYSKKSQNT